VIIKINMIVGGRLLKITNLKTQKSNKKQYSIFNFQTHQKEYWNCF